MIMCSHLHCVYNLMIHVHLGAVGIHVHVVCTDSVYSTCISQLLVVALGSVCSMLHVHLYQAIVACSSEI